MSRSVELLASLYGERVGAETAQALSDPRAKEPQEIPVARFIAAQAIMLSLVGVPGIYLHSLFGSRSWREGVAQTG